MILKSFKSSAGQSFIVNEVSAEHIAYLMIPSNSEYTYLVDENAIGESNAFLRDFLKKDYILRTLEKHIF